MNKPLPDMKTQLALLIAITLLVSACNQVDDLQPEETVPQSAINAVRAKFPNATDMVFKPLEKNRVWRVDFGQQASRYRGAVHDSLVLSAFRRIETTPDSVRRLVEATPIRGGQFTGDYKEQVVFKEGSFRYNVYLTNYTWQGKNYSLEYSDFKILGTNILYRTVSLSKPISFFYTSDDAAVLPDKVRNFLSEKGLSVEYRPYEVTEPIHVRVAEDQKKTYRLDAFIGKGGKDRVTVVLDDAGDYQYGIGGTRSESMTISDVPAVIRATFETNPDYTGFTFDRFRTFDLYGRKTNRVTLVNTANRVWTLTFDEQGVELSRSLGLVLD